MNDYLLWLANESCSVWWNDSARMKELENALKHGAQGVTTNPVLIADSLYAKEEGWAFELRNLLENPPSPERTEEIIRRITCKIAAMFRPVYDRTEGMQGYVCAQVDPRQAGNRGFMLDMARRLHTWAPNIAVKLPVTYAGLDVLEECISEGITVTATVSFTVPQVFETARRYIKGKKRAQSRGNQAGRCFSVVMVGRIDDYIRDVVHDGKMDIPEFDIVQCGTAIIKRLYEYYRNNNIDAILMPAGMRGSYHATSLAGGVMSMSIHPKIQNMLNDVARPYRQMINESIDKKVIKKLLEIPEFVRAYEPDGMKPADFITYGVVQKTLAQFTESWMKIESFSC